MLTRTIQITISIIFISFLAALTLYVTWIFTGSMALGMEAGTLHGRTSAPEGEIASQSSSTADHRRFEALNRDFSSGPEVTRACLSCHTEAAKQVQKSIHWKWLCTHSNDGRLGKAGKLVNNFCISLHSNEPRCTMCHVGYGWKDKSFDFTSEELVDCLVCHEQTGTYEKAPGAAGHPARETREYEGRVYSPPDWKNAAQSVARPTRRNCGTCHFSGGGGDGVKHGDLDSSLLQPKRDLDVHMDANKLDFQCTRCHTTKKHVISGRCYREPAGDKSRNLLEDDRINRICCESCHTGKPHPAGSKANDHTDKVACQTCHVPEFARENPTVVWWDWSRGGRKNEEGKPIVERNEFGKPSYSTKKGEQRWAKNVLPEYRWYRGTIDYLTFDDRIDPTGPVPLNIPQGEYGDPSSRIFPFKVHRGRQPYDKVNKNMVPVKLFGPKGSGAYWADYDWGRSVAAAAEYAGVPFSGEYDFVSTTNHIPISHMVAPGEQALSCRECHGENGRLKDLAGFYMPGRDRNGTLDAAGWLLVGSAFLGIGIHGLLLIVSRLRRRGEYAMP